MEKVNEIIINYWYIWGIVAAMLFLARWGLLEMRKVMLGILGDEVEDDGPEPPVFEQKALETMRYCVSLCKPFAKLYLILGSIFVFIFWYAGVGWLMNLICRGGM